MLKGLDKKLIQHTLIVVVSYTIISVAWIIFSDQIVSSLLAPAYQQQVQSYKGILFVFLTALFLILLISRKNSSIKKLYANSIDKLKTFEYTFEQAAVGIAHLSSDDAWIRVNKKLCDMLGYSKLELKSLTLEDIIHPDDFETGRKKDQELLSGAIESYVMKKRYITKAGNTFHAKITKSGVYDDEGALKYFVAIIEDITEEHKATKKLEKSLEQKELLIKEVHHRVKNNLAVISAFLELQKYRSKDETVKKVLTDSRMRIKAMALVHESFYQTELSSFVKFEKYLQDFIAHIESTFHNSEKDININLHSQPIELNINLAIPLSLLINELVTNAYLHAFDGRERGTIDIHVDKQDAIITAIVKDNGVGFPEGFDLHESSSFGTTIMETLSRQLDGDLELTSQSGSEISISFENKDISGSSSSRAASELI